MSYRIVGALLMTLLVAAAPAHAAFDDDLVSLQQHWAAARYQTSGDQRKQQLEKLASEADAFAKKYSDKAESYLWVAVVKASLAEAINNLSALSLAKEAKASLEKSIELDPKAEDSYAYGMLGAMYEKAPGWPIAFGSDKKARAMLKKGLEQSPDGMNVNYFNAQYAFDNDDYQQALGFITKAEKATPTPPAAIWAGRQQQIRELAEKIQKKLK